MIETIISNKKSSYQRTEIILIVFLSIFLNQQKPISGYNLSISDFAAVFLIIILICKKNFIIPQKAFYFFLTLSVFVLSVAFFISPYKFNYVSNSTTIIVNYTKLVSSFLYFIIGYNLYKYQKINIVYKWYSNTAVMIGLFGIIIVFLNINFLSKQYFFEGPRYIGMLNDPNYFSVIQCSALPYLKRNMNLKKIVKVIGFTMIFLSIILSGSKTGMITFIIYFIIAFGQGILTRKSKNKIIKFFIILIIILILLPIVLNLFIELINHILNKVPIFNRVLVLFNDFNAALSGSGSSRETKWLSAIAVIKQSPLLGVGIGSYLDVKNIIGEGSGLAHNTYLQIAAEWGLPLAMTLFSYMLFILSKHIVYNNKLHEDSLVIRDILIILLIGSLSLSLNNARMVWLFFGALSSSYRNICFKSNTGNYR